MINNYRKALIKLLADNGLDERSLAMHAGVPVAQLQSDEYLVPVVEAALRNTTVPDLGLRLGLSLDIGSHGVFGYALMSSATIGHVLQLLLQYNRIIMPQTKIEMLLVDDDAAGAAKGDGSGAIALRCSARAVSPQVERFFLEAFFAALQTTAAFLLQGMELPHRQQFSFPMPANDKLYREIFGDNIEFSAPASQLILPEALLDVAIPSYNPAAEVIFCEQCDLLLKQLGDREAVSARVQEILLRRRGEFPTIAEVASQLFMSESTLRRRLRDEGTNFQGLLDHLRLHLATQYLQETRLPVSEVGRLVGFDDVANFRRSFKRWSKETPSQTRQRLQAPP